MIRVNVITRVAADRGLARDLDVIREALAGHAEVCGVEMTQTSAPPAEVNVFCEVPLPRMFSCAPIQMLVPNPELWDRGWDARLQCVDSVLCKTAESFTFFSTMYRWMRQRAIYVGWCSDELYSASVPKERRFLHVGAVNDAFKGTDVLLEAWREFDMPYPLTVVGSARQTQERAVTALPHMSREAFVRELNRHAFHIVPSIVEGWCHAAHEAAGVGAVLIATDAPPMNDYATIRMPAAREHLDGRADRHRVTTAAIRTAVRACMELDDGEVAEIGKRGRIELRRANEECVDRIRAAILR